MVNVYQKKKNIKQLSYSLVPFDMSIHLVGSQSDYSQSMLRAEKRTAQLSAPAGFSGGENGGGLIRYTRMSFARFMLGQKLIFFGISLLIRQGSPCLIRGYLAYIVGCLYGCNI